MKGQIRFATRGEGELCDICGDAVGVFHCRNCNMLTCVSCAQSESNCECGIAHLTSSVSADLLPVIIDTMHTDEEGIISKSLIRDDRTFGNTSALQEQFRASEHEKLIAVQKYCQPVGKRSLEDAIALGDQWQQDGEYHFEGIPTPREHMDRQTNPRGLPIYRPPAMLKPIEGFKDDWHIHERCLNFYVETH